MDAKTLEGKRYYMKEKMIDRDDFPIEDDIEEDEGGGCFGFTDDDKKREVGVMNGKRGTGGGGASPPSCQVEKCGANLTDAKSGSASNAAGSMSYQSLMKQRGVAVGVWQDTMNAAGKNTAESCGEGSSRKGVGTQLKESPCRQADERGRFQMSIPPQGNSSYKRSQIT
ncbi:hypothetical protein OIU84_002961 [Salix udensis]|uniref:Uncharacterized protein n=1 Tax=Salix udensis TaxID=889485 RepID=A0AAD6P5U8_9ROSI|nr:hypothetical protein OIU84_002961 [Salix udensis]